jgi:ATP-binding cassette subfamily B (MDR/TAP) protein 7
MLSDASDLLFSFS